MAFYEGAGALKDSDLECKLWIDSILEDKAPVVLPEQAFAVTQILEAIYTSSRRVKRFTSNKKTSWPPVKPGLRRQRAAEKIFCGRAVFVLFYRSAVLPGKRTSISVLLKHAYTV